MEAVFPHGKRVDVQIGQFDIPTDQSKANGGESSAPEPFDLFLASIVACAGIYAKSFCDVRKLNTEGMKLTQELKRNADTRVIEEISLKLHVPADFPEKYERPVLKAMNSCSVKKQLRSDIEFKSTVVRR